MSDEHAPTDDDAFAETASFERRLLFRGQRLPTDTEIRDLQERFGMTHIAATYLLREIVQAGIFYFAYENPETPNAQYKRLERVRKRTDDLLAAMGKATVDVVLQNEGLYEITEPPGIRGMLYQLRDNADRQLAALEPLVTDERQRKQAAKGIKPFISHLAGTAARFRARIGSIYTQDPITGEYSGDFFEYVETTCRLCGINLSNQTIGDNIKRLNSRGKLPCFESVGQEKRKGSLKVDSTDNAPFSRAS
jgi:hypothetical protein